LRKGREGTVIYELHIESRKRRELNAIAWSEKYMFLSKNPSLPKIR